MSHPEEQPKIIIDEDWKSQVQAEKEALKQTEDQPSDASSDPAAKTEQPAGEVPPPPPPSYPQLVTIFATQATVSLQQAANPEDAQRASHLDYAKHFIDLLGVLEEKTKGNLSAEEAQMTENVLHELRMAYVSMRK